MLLSLSSQLRKAEFILADAMEKGSDCIVTYGGLQSNHARTMAVAAREVGLDSTLFIKTLSPEVISTIVKYHKHPLLRDDT